MYKKFEYKTVSVKPKSAWLSIVENTDIERTLNEYGQQGWELVTLQDFPFGSNVVGVRLTFKRQTN